ncbi:MAG: glutamate--tRNA ligase [Ferrimicrobium sp.]|uniref:Glutamate--tRNA ligase n=1 Tax=Ferrimicrobium acidiphilum TaxID=121039 RepID=A0ABV3XYD2_9ACTN|nr:glutamate--tRNA ligase [Ferrimicrobium sp.]MCL5973538.1 glutamate--tRNA ligase [Actinomycetota bacterium]
MSPSHPERVRFAPSPTGFFHVGSARTILYNWLLARQSNGAMLLRIDDTDTERNREEWVDGIYRAIRWLGLDWDEGPVRQSTRIDHYQAIAFDLFERGLAYWCDCTRETLDARKPPGTPPGYDGFCRDRKLSQGPGRALRFRVREGEIVVNDLIRSQVIFPAGAVEDFVILKSSLAPLYVLANVIDDIDFSITTVLRAEEHLPTTPKAVLLHEALGGPLPRFGHLPVLVNEQRRKLSKRRDRVAVEDYRQLGYLPEPMINYLALLGWNPGDDREFFTLDELIHAFSLERVGHSPAYFDEQRLLHFNKTYIASLSAQEFARIARPFVDPMMTGSTDGDERLAQILPEVQTRIGTLSELPAMIGFLFHFSPDYDELADRLRAGDDHYLKAVADVLAVTDPFDSPTIETSLRTAAEELGTSLRKLQAPVRIAITGAPIGPPLFHSMAILGRDECLRRIQALLEALHQRTPAPEPPLP